MRLDARFAAVGAVVSCELARGRETGARGRLAEPNGSVRIVRAVSFFTVFCVVFAMSVPVVHAVPIGTITEFSAGLKPNSLPASLVETSDGNLWLTDGAAIGRVAPSGEIQDFTGPMSNENSPQLLVAGPDGYLWFSDRDEIGRISLDGTITEFPFATDPDAQVGGMVLGPDGDVWFTERNYGSAIERITPSGEVTKFTVGLNAESSPDDITAGPDGNIWFTDAGKKPAIGRVTPNGEITEFSEGLKIENEPRGIISGPDGNLWFVDGGKDGKAIGRITSSGTITLFTGNLEEECGDRCEVGSLTLGPNGSLWFTVGLGGGGGTIGRITPSGETTEFMPELGFAAHPESLVSAPDGNIWFASYNHEPGNGVAIGRITPSGTITGFSAGLNPVGIPSDLTVGSDGNVWFADGSAIGRITVSAQPLSAPAVAQVTHPAIAVLASRRLQFRSGLVRVELRCRGTSACTGRLRLAIEIKSRHGKRRLVTIASAQFSVPASATRTIKVPVKPAIRKLLTSGPRHRKGRMTIAQIGSPPQRPRSVQVSLAVPRASHKRTR